MPQRKNKKNKKASAVFERGAFLVIARIGSMTSIIAHTVFFLVFFILGLIGFNWNTLLLILTTVVSLEAIYLAIFIQMTVNQNTQSLAEVEEDIDEIQEDIDDIQEDVDEIQKDVDDIVEEEKEAETYERKQALTLEQIQNELQRLAGTIEQFRAPAKKK